MNFNKLKFTFCFIAFTFLISLNAQAECCKGLDELIGIMAFVAGIPVLFGLFFLITNLLRLKKALNLITYTWVATIIVYCLIYIGFVITDDYGSNSLETLGGLLGTCLLPISGLLIFTTFLYLIKEGVQKTIKEKQDYEGGK